MIPYQVDPSLHPERPAPQQLDDGFSPPVSGDASAPPAREQGAPTPDAALPAKSDF